MGSAVDLSRMMKNAVVFLIRVSYWSILCILLASADGCKGWEPLKMDPLMVDRVLRRPLAVEFTIILAVQVCKLRVSDSHCWHSVAHELTV